MAEVILERRKGKYRSLLLGTSVISHSLQKSADGLLIEVGNHPVLIDYACFGFAERIASRFSPCKDVDNIYAKLGHPCEIASVRCPYAPFIASLGVPVDTASLR